MTLLGSKRFTPFFLTQCLGAFNDNLFKNVIILGIVYQIFNVSNPSLFINISAFVFIVPFFLFSALGGQLADKYEKTKLIRCLKFSELLIMSFGAVGIILNDLFLMLFSLFFMGVQSALFGPVKYSILPEILNENELIGGNALVEMGTFIFILLGTILSGYLIEVDDFIIIGMTIVFISVVGLIFSFLIPSLPSSISNSRLNFNFFKGTFDVINMLFKQQKSVSRSALGNSWFWFIGAVFLTQIPLYAQSYLNGDPSMVTLILAIFTVSIALGSILCGKLSREHVEIGLVPIGSLGISVFIFLLSSHSIDIAIDGSVKISAMDALSNESFLIVFFDLMMIGIFAGFYIVPLYAIIQTRTDKGSRSRIIAGNNILNAGFMVLSSLFTILLFEVFNLNLIELFLIIGLMNLIINIYIFFLVPEFIIRFIMWAITNTIYRVKYHGLKHIPENGPGLIASNHISFIDALVIGGAVQRPIRFVMYYKIFKIPVLKWIFKLSGAIPIAGKHENINIYNNAFNEIEKTLNSGELVGIFPEGKITLNGEINDFKKGIEKIINKTPVPVIPMALDGLYGGFFSKAPKKIPFKRIWSKINVYVSNELDPKGLSAERVQNKVQKMIDCSNC